MEFFQQSPIALIKRYLRENGLTPEAIKNEHRLEIASRLASHFPLHAWRVKGTMKKIAAEINVALPDLFANFSNDGPDQGVRRGRDGKAGRRSPRAGEATKNVVVISRRKAVRV